MTVQLYDVLSDVSANATPGGPPVTVSTTAPGQNAAIQIVTPNEMRGQISAIYLFSISVVGGGFGPTAIALITDKVFHSEAMLRYAMSGFSVIVGPLIVFLIFAAIGPYARAYQRLRVDDRS